MYKKLTFSKYFHVMKKDNVAAIFHSLKMKPIYLDCDIFELVKKIIESPKEYSDEEVLKEMDIDIFKQAINALLENRVLNEHAGTDEKVISHFRNSIGVPKIKIAYFVLAESCNLSCSYCFEKAPSISNYEDKLMTEDVALKSINFFENMLKLYPSSDETKDIIFYGGEPLLNYDVLIFVLEEISNRKAAGNILWDNVNLSMVTNGTLIKSEMIDRFKDLGLSIAISIDGPKDINDKNRFYNNRKSSFEDVIKGLKICKDGGLNFSLSITLSEECVKNSDRTIDFIDQIEPGSIGFNILMTDNNFTVYDNYNEDAAEFLISAYEKFSQSGLYEDRMMRKVNSFIGSEVYPFDCGATGGNQLVFSPSGRVGICHGYLQEKKYFPTTVNDESFDPSSDRVFKEWAVRSPLNMNECQDCEALGICGGGCPMNAERNLGSIWDLDERFCVHSKKTLEWLVWKLYENSKA